MTRDNICNCIKRKTKTKNTFRDYTFIKILYDVEKK